MLFFLGLPNKGPKVQGATIPVDLTHDFAASAALVSSDDPFQRLTLFSFLGLDSPSNADTLNFTTLYEGVARNSESRAEWDGKWIKVKGQFLPNQNLERQFGLVRFRIRCCGQDAIPLSVPMVCKESVRGIEADQWVDVTGQVGFQRMGSHFISVLKIPSRRAIVPTSPDPDFYVR
jgi:uncharacterized membrane protein YcgQ (UPF0703/DUF1980 family)